VGTYHSCHRERRGEFHLIGTILLWPKFFIRFLLRVIRDCDGVLRGLSEKPYKKQFVRTGSCKKRGVCCHNIAVHLSSGFWKAKPFRRFVIAWYELVYNFKLKQELRSESVLIFKCHYLKENRCSIYHKRPAICRNYPEAQYFGEPITLPGCGYQFKRND